MKHIEYIVVVIMLSLMVVQFRPAQAAETNRMKGNTKMAQTTDLFQPQSLKGGEDNGVNVLLDHAHQFTFFAAWSIPLLLREGGFRVIGSQATLDTVLTPGQLSRVRFGYEKQRPFDWWPNPEFNAVITYQTDPRAQDYLPEEVEAVREFVEAGGGLIIISGGGGVYGADAIDRLPINSLAREFGATLTDQASSSPFSDSGDQITAALELPDSGKLTALSLDASWQTLISGANDAPILAAREFGRGRVAILSSMDVIKWGKDGPGNGTESKKANGTFLHGLLHWVSVNRPPVGGSRNLPSEAWGGGPIYPELETEIGGVTVFYAKNQKEASVKVISEDMPDVKAQIEAWFPSAPPPGRMYLILSSGGGGGWAVNVYEPKEVGIISLDAEGILSVFAHELAHTMYGPPNDRGEVAGRLPGLFSEAHAGWFQGKIVALRTGNRGGHEPNLIFEKDTDGKTIDIAKLSDGAGEFRTGWNKLWWIWQKMDEQYGPTWYPRWMWVKNMRWQDEPDRRLTWDDVVEDMSIAVGEDLFPFFREIGTTLQKERFPTAAFMGQTIKLPAAQIAITKGNAACPGAIGDYKQEIQ